MDNFIQLNKVKEFSFTKQEWIKIAKMSFEGSFLDEAQKKAFIQEVEDYAILHGVGETKPENASNKENESLQQKSDSAEVSPTKGIDKRTKKIYKKEKKPVNKEKA